MSLKESLESQIELLLKQIESNNEQQEIIKNLKLLVETLLNNVNEIDQFELDKYVDEIYKQKEEVNIEEMKNKLNTLRQIAAVNREMDNAFFTFDDNQKKFIKDFCIEINAFIKNLEEKQNINKSPQKYQKILDKINHQEKMTLEDLILIMELFQDQKNQDNYLKDFYHYNLEIENKEYENRESTEKVMDKNEIEEKLNKISEVLKKYGSVKKMTQSLSTHQLELATKIDLKNATEVLDTLKQLQIYNEFSPEAILTIMLYGTKDSVIKAYQEFSSSENVIFNNDVVYKFPSLWTEQDQKENTTKKLKKPRNDGGGIEKTISLQTFANQMTRKELYEKIEFYQSHGFDIIKDNKRIVKGLIPTLELIKDKYKDFKLYDVSPNLSSFVTIGNVKQACDEMIECDLLMPFQENQNTHSRYANKYPTFIGLHKKGHILIIESLLGTKDFNEIFSTSNPCYLAKEFSRDMEIKNMKFDLEKYKKDNSMEITSAENFSRYEELTIAAYNADFDPMLLENDIKFIQNLDEKYKENNYRYKIDNSIISRMKVIRLYEALQKYNETLPEENKLEENDIRFFAITYGTYIKKDTYEKIKQEVYERGSRKR